MAFKEIPQDQIDRIAELFELMVSGEISEEDYIKKIKKNAKNECCCVRPVRQEEMTELFEPYTMCGHCNKEVVD